MLYHLGTENEKVLLFLDIIGFSELVKNSDGFDANDGKSHGIALMFPDFYSTLMTLRYSKENQAKRNIKFLWASDSIMISTDVNNVDALFEDLIYLQNQFYCGGMAFRGTICIGNLYHQENIWGEPLVRAAEIEKNKVKFPRVIISKGELSKLPISENYKLYLLQDELNEDFMYFSPFQPNIDIILNNPIVQIHSTLNVYSRLVAENYENAPTDDKNKWQWMAKQLLSTLEHSSDEIFAKLEIEAENGSANCDLNENIRKLKKIIK